MTDIPLPLDGGCFCGTIRYRIAKAPLFAMACHCTDCQTMTASAFSLGLIVPRDGFDVIAGNPRGIDKIADSGETSTRFVCPDCACWTHTHTTGSPDATIVRPSSLDRHDWVRPTVQIFTRSALSWALLPTLFTWETEFDDPSPIARAFAAGCERFVDADPDAASDQQEVSA